MAEEIKIYKEKESVALGPSDDVCNICLKQFAKYTCPRCNARYCSLPCYRSEKHLRCSESFYKDSVVESLKDQKGSNEEKKKMVEILKRMRDTEGSGAEGGGFGGEGSGGMGELEEDGELDLHDRFSDMDLSSVDADAMWDRLTAGERQEFERLLSEGRLADMLDSFTPWWTSIPRVQVVGSDDSSCNPALPKLLSNAPDLSALLQGKSPSPSVKYDIVNVLYSYCYVVRLYNGDHLELCSQAAQDVLGISGCLGGGGVQGYASCQEALSHAMTTIQQTKGLWNSSEFSRWVLSDVAALLAPSWLPAVGLALSDLHHLTERGRRGLKRSQEREADSQLCKLLWLASKKCVFYLSWCGEYLESLQQLKVIVQWEIENAKVQDVEKVSRETDS